MVNSLDGNIDVLVISNPAATGIRKANMDEVKKLYKKTFGDRVSFVESLYEGHIKEIIMDANDKVKWIITMGGDGTFGEAFQVFNGIDQNVYYSHIPVGTANDTASNLNLPSGDPYISSQMLLDSTLDNYDVDLPTLNGLGFGYVSICGLFSNIPYDTPKVLKKNLGTNGYYFNALMSSFSIIKDLINKPLHLRYEKDGKIVEVEALSLIVSNSKTFGGLKLYPNANITDGNMKIAILKKLPFSKANKVLKELNSSHFDMNEYDDYIETFDDNEFKVYLEKPIKYIDNDGDKVLVDSNTLDYKVRGKVKMLLPK